MRERGRFFAKPPAARTCDGVKNTEILSQLNSISELLSVAWWLNEEEIIPKRSIEKRKTGIKLSDKMIRTPIFIRLLVDLFLYMRMVRHAHWQTNLRKVLL